MFRKATKADAAPLKTLAREVILHNYTSFLGEDAVNDFIESGAADTEIENGIESCIVMVEQDGIIGFAITNDNLLHLLMVAVKYQRKGYGEKLLAFIELQMFHSHDSLELQTFQDNIAANRFYGKNGWMITKEKPQDASPIPIIYYEKRRQG